MKIDKRQQVKKWEYAELYARTNQCKYPGGGGEGKAPVTTAYWFSRTSLRVKPKPIPSWVGKINE